MRLWEGFFRQPRAADSPFLAVVVRLLRRIMVRQKKEPVNLRVEIAEKMVTMLEPRDEHIEKLENEMEQMKEFAVFRRVWASEVPKEKKRIRSMWLDDLKVKGGCAHAWWAKSLRAEQGRIRMRRRRR